MRSEPITAPVGLAVGQVQRMLLLRTFPAYAQLSPEHLAVLAAYTRQRFYRAGEHLSREGRPATSIHFVVSGEVELWRSGAEVRRLGPKSVVGGLSAFAREPQGYDAVARTETVALEMHVDDSLDIFEDHFALLKTVLRAISAEVLRTRKRMGPSAGFGHAEVYEGPSPERPLDLVERMARLRKSISFAESRLDAIAELAREAREERHPPGAVLWREGERMDSFCVLASGIVTCASRETGQQFRFGAGDAVGALDAMAALPRWYTATVTDDAVLLRIECETMFDLFEDHFELATDVLAMMARSILASYDVAAEESEEARG